LIENTFSDFLKLDLHKEKLKKVKLEKK
jgi:hypothetical protein